jgi:hypothetical protein
MPRRSTTAPAQPDDIVQLNLRIRESERRLLAERAKRDRVSLNGLMAGLLMSALEQEQMLVANQLIENMVRGLSPLLSDVHELNVSGDYRRAINKLTTLLRPFLKSRSPIDGRAADAFAAVLDEIDNADRMVEIELGRRLRRMHTTGAKS